jgi:hypothetical protein
MHACCPAWGCGDRRNDVYRRLGGVIAIDELIDVKVRAIRDEDGGWVGWGVGGPLRSETDRNGAGSSQSRQL